MPFQNAGKRFTRRSICYRSEDPLRVFDKLFKVKSVPQCCHYCGTNNGNPQGLATTLDDYWTHKGFNSDSEVAEFECSDCKRVTNVYIPPGWSVTVSNEFDDFDPRALSGAVQAATHTRSPQHLSPRPRHHALESDQVSAARLSRT